MGAGEVPHDALRFMREVANMSADIDMQRDVEAELLWVPAIDKNDIAVKATLTGYVPSDSERCRAEGVLERVASGSQFTRYRTFARR